MGEQILFWSGGEPQWRFLSHFWAAPLMYDGKLWPTAEHLFHGLKYSDPRAREAVRLLATPQDAKKFRADAQALSPDWKSRRVSVMGLTLTLKFSQHPQLLDKLLATGPAELVHYAPWGDTYWGVDKEMKGQNVQGTMLMMLRTSMVSLS